MSIRRILLVLIIFAFSIANAQITNVRKWRKSEVDSLDHGLFLFDERLFLQAAPIFEQIMKNHPKEEFVKYTFAKCALFRSDKHEEAYLIFTELYPKYNDIQDFNYDIALASLYNNRFDEAEEYNTKFLATKRISLQDKRRADALKSNIVYARYYTAIPTSAKVFNLGSNINTPGDEYVPAITADESTLIFTYVGENSIGGRQNEYQQPDPKGFFAEDIYISRKKDGEFQKAERIDSLCSNLPDAAISQSIDGSTLFMYQDLDDGHGDIYKCELQGKDYTKPKKLKGINSFSWDGHCSLSPNGKVLYFSSERVGGYGGRDIYKAELMADSTWGDVTNLGDSINTRFDDDAPFIHADGRTLFFSSKGRTSMGGYDIFRSTYNPMDSTFGHAENLGCPINSTDDDIYFVLAANGKSAYYSSGRKGGQGLKDIYKVEANFADPVSALYLVEGTVKSEDVPVEAAIKIQNLNTNTEFSSLRSNSSSGFYLSALPAGARYKITYSYQTKSPKIIEVDATATSGFTQSAVNIDFAKQIDSVVPIVTPVIAAVQPVSQASLASASTSSVKASAAPTSSTLVVPAVASATPSIVKPVVAGAAIATAVKTPTVKDNFIPNTKFQEKTMRYVAKYGDISAPDLEFKVQFSAFKSGKNYAFPHLSKIGKIDRVILGDGYTRLVIGGSFKTLRPAWSINKKVVNAGEKEAFIQAYYKGKRTSFEELEKLKIFVEK